MRNALLALARSATITAAAGMALTAIVMHQAATRAQAIADGRTAARHCVVDFRTGRPSCYGTFTEAIAYASQGEVADAPGDARAAGDRLRGELRHTTVLGTFFAEKDYGGNSLTVFGGNPCGTHGSITSRLDLNDDWKNRISSLRPWGNCWIWLSTGPDLRAFGADTPDLGASMDDRTRSLGFG
jgi:hypothetical protein